MNCRKVQSYLSAYSENSLSSDQLNELEVHIRDCKSCEREKLLVDEILVAAKSLPTKQVPEDFNLKLFSRIYAEQNNPTESYLPLREPSFLRRPVGWASALATLAVTAMVTLVVVRNQQQPTEEQLLTPSYTQVVNATPVSGVLRHSGARAPMNVYDNIIGVSGASSNYRATNISQLRTLHLADAKVESLMVELQKQLGRGVIPASGMFVRQFDNGFSGSPYQLARSRNSTGSLIRNAAASSSY